MADRNEKGHFLPGNRVSVGAGRPSPFKDERKPVRAEVIKCAQSLLRPWETLEKELESKDLTRLEFLTNMAAKTGNYKFIQWLLEMAVGKPKQTIDVEDKATSSNVTITIPSNRKEIECK